MPAPAGRPFGWSEMAASTEKLSSLGFSASLLMEFAVMLAAATSATLASDFFPSVADAGTTSGSLAEMPRLRARAVGPA